MAELKFTYIDSDKAYELVKQGVVGAEFEGKTRIRFTLSDQRKLIYDITGFSAGCDSCGWGSEAYIDCQIEVPDGN